MKKMIVGFFSYFLRFKAFRKVVQIMIWQLEIYNGVSVSKHISPKKIVLDGPFIGMKYPEYTAMGSSILPKFLGSYEDEIYPVIEKLINKNYSEILDIGCAEGYYAVGLALRKPNATIYAYDVDENAIAIAKEMSNLNGVNNIEFKGFCTPKDLATFQFKERGFVLSDCEGYEKELFTGENLNNLRNVDILIEIHDMNGVDIQYFIQLFENTHYHQVISSKHKHVKDYPVLLNSNLKGIDDGILHERSSRMNWLVLESKIN